MSTRGSGPVIGRAIKVSVEEPLLATAIVMACSDDAPAGSYNALLVSPEPGTSRVGELRIVVSQVPR